MASIFRFLFRINKSEYGNILGSVEMYKSVFWQGWERKKHIVVACFHFWQMRESDVFSADYSRRELLPKKYFPSDRLFTH